MTTPPARPTPSPTSFPLHASDGSLQRALASAMQTLLRHARQGTIVLRGPNSGNVYSFSDRAATAVLNADVDALLRTGMLVRVNRP